MLKTRPVASGDAARRLLRRLPMLVALCLCLPMTARAFGATLGEYPDVVVALGGNITVVPTAPPADFSGAFAPRLAVNAPSYFRGVIAVDTATGIVTITNANPTGLYSFAVRLMDGNNVVLASRTFLVAVYAFSGCYPTTLDGNFVTSTGSPVGTEELPATSEVGDFNGDGRQDLLVANGAAGITGAGYISVFLGDGNGGFADPVNIKVATMRINGMAVGDFDNDGRQDFVATVARSADNILEYLGNGDGTFRYGPGSTSTLDAPTRLFQSGGYDPQGIVVADINNDGRDDLAVTNRSLLSDVTRSSVSVFIGSRDGGFTPAAGSPIQTLARDAFGIKAGDFNLDGRTDLVVVTRFTNTAQILLQTSVGIAQFTQSTLVVGTPSTNEGSGATNVAVADVNSDGFDDLIFDGFNASPVMIVKLGDGAGGFTEGTAITAFATFGLAATDIDGDGDIDILAGLYNQSRIGLWLGDGAGNFTAGGTLPASIPTPRLGAVGDFNGDNMPDFVSSESSLFRLQVYLGSCDVTVTTAALPAARPGVPYEAATTYSGATAPVFTAFRLPAGLSIDPVTGMISGTVTDVSGTYYPQIQLNEVHRRVPLALDARMASESSGGESIESAGSPGNPTVGGGTAAQEDVTITFKTFVLVVLPAPAVTRLTLVKEVVNDNGGTATAASFTLSASGPTSLSGSGGAAGSVAPGVYTLSESGPSGYAASAWVCLGTASQSAAQITLAAGQSASCTITNNDIAPDPPPAGGTARIVKTVGAAPPLQAPGAGFVFHVRMGATLSAAGSIQASVEASSANGGVTSFALALVPGTAYQMCEAGMLPGWSTTLSQLPGAFVPAGSLPDADNSVICVGFSVAAGERRTFTVDNTPPPFGDARGIGFWKNWSSCSGGRQQPVLDQTLAALSSHGVLVGDLFVGTCEGATRILAKSRTDTGRKVAKDAVFGLAAQLLAARLNVARTAYSNACVTSAIADAQALLDRLNFNGVSHEAVDKSTSPQLASLAATLERYNWNLLGSCS